MSSLADQTIDADRVTFDRLAGVVRSLDGDQLRQQSGAAEWTVAQVLSHLGSAAEIYLATLQAARAGNAHAGDNQAVWDRWNALSPEDQAAGFLESGAAVLAAFADMGPDERAALRVPLSYLPEPAPLDLFAGLRLNELALHAWDVDVAFDSAATLDPAVASVLVELLRGPIGFMPGFTGKPPEQHQTLRVTAGEHVFGLDLGERVQLIEEPSAPDGELAMPVEAFPRLLAGRLRDAPAGLQVEGPVSFADLQRIFPGY